MSDKVTNIAEIGAEQATAMTFSPLMYVAK